MTAREQIQAWEGLRLSPYLDCCSRSWRECTCAVKGKLTIGYGHNLDDKPIPREVAELLFEHDYRDAEADLVRALPWVPELAPPRGAVLISLVFNLGSVGLLKFRKMLAALRAGDYSLAAFELNDSIRATQVGERGVKEAEQLRTGTWQQP